MRAARRGTRATLNKSSNASKPSTARVQNPVTAWLNNLAVRSIGVAQARTGIGHTFAFTLEAPLALGSGFLIGIFDELDGMRFLLLDRFSASGWSRAGIGGRGLGHGNRQDAGKDKYRHRAKQHAGYHDAFSGLCVTQALS
jgi:hypothetical protein